LLRVYRRNRGGPAATSFDLAAHLRPESGQPETDIEGCTWLGGRMYWITSHGRNRKAKLRESRERLFATQLTKQSGRWTMVAVGAPYGGLLDELLSAPQLQRFDLNRAAQRAPKDKDGLNIEGLAATPEGSLWIGFRNPLRNGLALIVPLHNPESVIGVGNATTGARAILGFPIEIDLGGLGIRSIEYVAGIEEYLILAGPPASGTVALYRWTGRLDESPRLVPDVSFGSLTPEAFVVYAGQGDTEWEVHFFSDDGTREIDGQDCKQVEEPARRRFRTVVWKGLLPRDKP
jgi:hypothetical protein